MIVPILIRINEAPNVIVQLNIVSLIILNNQILAMQSLIRREGHLIVVDDGRQAAAEGEGRPSRDDRILAVAPNYVID